MDVDADAVRFRPGKKQRRAYRQSAGDAPPPPPDPDPDPDPDAAVAAAVRARSAARRARLRGVGFASQHPPPPSPALVAPPPDDDDDDAAAEAGIAGRFTHQTGLVAHLHDRHMNEYIESRLSSRVAASAPADADADVAPPHGDSPPARAAAAAAASFSAIGDQPTKHGKLFEVAVPDAARDRRYYENRWRPELPPKPRRRRQRRGSDDIKRDQFVEQFLHENRLDVYDVPSQPAAAPPPAPGDKRTADDRMAEQFRRQYFDELALRRQRRRPANPPRPPTADVLRGPKLGGSRNSRAAIRNILLQQEKDKAGNKVV